MWVLTAAFIKLIQLKHLLDDTTRNTSIAKLSSSSVQSSPVELSTALILIISTHPPPPTHPHPRDSSNEAVSDYLWGWNLVWKSYSTKLGQLAK